MYIKALQTSWVLVLMPVILATEAEWGGSRFEVSQSK
jgi:hypothetical protein